MLPFEKQFLESGSAVGTLTSQDAKRPPKSDFS